MQLVDKQVVPVRHPAVQPFFIIQKLHPQARRVSPVAARCKQARAVALNLYFPLNPTCRLRQNAVLEFRTGRLAEPDTPTEFEFPLGKILRRRQRLEPRPSFCSVSGRKRVRSHRCPSSWVAVKCTNSSRVTSPNCPSTPRSISNAKRNRPDCPSSGSTANQGEPFG